MSETDAQSKTSILASYASVLTGDFGRLIVFALFVPLLVRVVGNEGYGQYALVMATFMISRKLLNVGLFDATKTYISRASGADRVRIIVTALTIQVAVLAIALPVGYLGTVIVPLDPVIKTSVRLVLFMLVGEQLYNFGRGVMHALNDERLVEILIPVRSAILAVVGLGLAASGYGVTGIFVGFAVAFLSTGGVVTAVALGRAGLGWTPPRPSRLVAARLVRFGFPSMLLLLLTAGLYKTDIFLVSYFLTPAETGLYRASLQVAEFIWVVAVAMELVMIQTTSELWERDDRETISDLTRELLTYVIVLTALLIVGVAVLGDEFLGVYFGPEYTTSALPLRLLLPGVFGFAIARGIWPVLQAGGYLQGVVAAAAAAMLVNLVLNVLLIPRFGISGAAAATSLSYGGMALLQAAMARRVSLRPLAGIPFIRIGVAAATAGGALIILETFVPPLLALVTLPPVGLSIYAACIFAFQVLSVSEIRSFLNNSFVDVGT